MSAEIIKVLDYLCAKFGIAIDWTAENIWPQVLDFVGRYQMYAVTRHLIAVAMCVIIGIICVVIAKKMNNCDWDGLDVVVQFGCIIATIICLIVLIVNIFSAIEWGIVPEMRFVEMLSEYTN